MSEPQPQPQPECFYPTIMASADVLIPGTVLPDCTLYNWKGEQTIQPLYIVRPATYEEFHTYATRGTDNPPAFLDWLASIRDRHFYEVTSD
jgi:hypothetical protein